MRRYGQDNSEFNIEENKKAIKKGFSFEDAKNNFLAAFSSRKTLDRKFSKKIYDMVSDKEEHKYKRAARHKSSLHQHQNRNKKEGKARLWLNKTFFTAGRIRFTRFAAAATLFAVIALTSGYIVLASSTGLFDEVMPIDNVNLIPAQKTIYIHDGGDVSLFKTDGGTVRDILKTNDIELGKDDKVYPSLATKAYNRMSLEIKRAMNVEVKTHEDQQPLMLYSGTVADALKQAGIEYDEDDIIEPALNTELKDGAVISYDKVEIKTVTEEVVVEFETEYRDEPTVLKGLHAIPQEGKDGKAKVTYEVKYVNGLEESREIIKEEITKEPVTEVYLVGTGLKRRDSDEDKEEDKTDVPNPDEQTTNPKVPGTSVSYVETVSCMVTAYTHTGHHTATGTWPRSTRTYENPGTCAVVPDTFPYGSLLYVTGYGYCIAEDTGGFRHNSDRWNQIDVFMNTAPECSTWGRRRDVTVYVIRYGR